MGFIGGIHPIYHKITKREEIEIAHLPKQVILPLSQHTGKPSEPLVKVGDRVKVGQKIAEASAFVSASMHASISGKVTAIEEKPHPVLGKCMAIVIESDGKIEWHESVKARDNIDNLTKEELISIIKEAGIVGLGGAAFPTHVKLKPPEGKEIDTVILNGAECEPYLACDHRVMLEKTEDMIKGLKIIMKILGADNACIGIEDNKKDAIDAVKGKIDETEKKIKVVSLKTIYPEGAEKMLIYSILKRKVPSGGLPFDVGVVVNNVQTAKSIYDAVYEGKPLVERVITVSGSVKHPKNLLVKIGTPFNELIEQAGGIEEESGKLINGGPMMGIAQNNDEVPVIKGTSGILFLGTKRLKFDEELPCIKCGRCVDACPVLLMPTRINECVKKDRLELAEEFYAQDCIECGCCSYVCPSKIPLVERIRYAKAEIMKKRKK